MQTGFFDPKTKQVTAIDTCFGTHHLQFAEDADNTLVFSNPGGQEVGWLNTKLYDQTKDARLSQGWCPTVLDTNGDGTITKPFNQPVRGDAVTGDEDSETARAGRVDPKLDTRIIAGPYGIIVNPVDNAIWGSTDEVEVPGQIFRIARGDNPPATCVTERYFLPKELGYRPRGIDVDRNGVIWTALAGSAQMASFDRRKCKVLNGPPRLTVGTVTEGWTFYPQPGPAYKGTNDRNAEFSYYNWVDQFNTLGLGEKRPDCQRLGLRLAARPPAGDEGVGGDARPLSHGAAQPRDGRPDRRSEWRLERARHLFDLWGRMRCGISRAARRARRTRC